MQAFIQDCKEYFSFLLLIKNTISKKVSDKLLTGLLFPTYPK